MYIFSSCFGIVGICSIRRASITNCRCIQHIAWIFKPSRSTFSFIILFYWKKLHKIYIYYHGTLYYCYEIFEKCITNKPLPLKFLYSSMSSSVSSIRVGLRRIIAAGIIDNLLCVNVSISNFEYFHTSLK